MLQKVRIFFMNQLGFTLKEANGVIILLFIMAFVIIGPVFYSYFFAQESNKELFDLEAMKQWKSEIVLKKEGADYNEKLSTIELHPFDPNVISTEEWIQMGIKKTTAERIGRYLQAGGSFAVPEDLYKIYGIDSFQVANLISFIKIPAKLDDSTSNYVSKTEFSNTETSIEELPTIIKTNINQATATELKQIWGIGDKLSERIIKYRDALGGYVAIDQLREVYYLNDSIIPKIDEKFLFDSQPKQLIDINTDSIKVLASHPYIDHSLARAIVNYRTVHGIYTHPEALLQIKIMTDSIYHKLKPYLSVKE